jgi:hypothetical protein
MATSAAGLGPRPAAAGLRRATARGDRPPRLRAAAADRRAAGAVLRPCAPARGFPASTRAAPRRQPRGPRRRRPHGAWRAGGGRAPAVCLTGGPARRRRGRRRPGRDPGAHPPVGRPPVRGDRRRSGGGRRRRAAAHRRRPHRLLRAGKPRLTARPNGRPALPTEPRRHSLGSSRSRGATMVNEDGCH